jgi:hypothetical protein
VKDEMDAEFEELEIGWAVSFFRACGVLLAWLVAFGALTYAFCGLGYGLMTYWVPVVCPHLLFVREGGDGPERLFTDAGAIIVAIVQWVLATGLFGLLTCRLILRLQFLLAPFFIFVLWAVVRIAVWLMGIQVLTYDTL